ncbi:MAG: peptidase T [Spirochaeta sp.]|jgi:tripeptide aminopeptidase|nr:peptidase T [Spirochaeta sp.]
MNLQPHRDFLTEDVQERFLRYVRVHTTSDRHADTTPSTQRQFDLAHILAGELRDLGLTDVTVTEFGYVIARVPAHDEVNAPPVAFLAHMDTAPDSSGEDVNPRIWENYDGGVLTVGHGIVLDPTEYPDLRDFVGETIITTDGTTLLGADDKAGVAEIMAAVRFLGQHPEYPHPELEIIFTPDEEIGRGVDKLPVTELHSRFAYTMDGGKEGSVEAECFNAYRVHVDIQGYLIHPGSARGKMANAVTIAGRLLAALPQSESPEATDGRYGFYCPVEITGDYGHARIEMIIRDFEIDEVRRRVAYIEKLADALQTANPRARITVTATQQYLNMRDRIAEYPFLLELLTEAITSIGVTPILDPIRGGTDGARLTEMGLPTPNIFAGGLNFHGPAEWIPVRSMVRATETILTILRLWSERVAPDTPLPTVRPEVRA